MDQDLTKAIKQASKATLERTFLSILATNETARRDATALLLVDSASTPPPSTTGQKRAASPDAQQPAKRTARYEHCENCEVEYDVTKNGDEDCVTHPGTFLFPPSFYLFYWLLFFSFLWNGKGLTLSTGEMYADDEGDFWADHDEDCHGVIDDLKDEYPEGFIWDCCDKHGDEPGCRVAKHSPILS